MDRDCRGLLGSAAFDVALEAASACGYTYAGGLANHAPMTAVALAAFGADEQLHHYLDTFAVRYADRDPFDAATVSVERSLRAAVDLIGPEQTLCRVLDAQPDTVFTSAFHGALRTAYAYRALCIADSAVRRDELARGLALLIAAPHRPFPGVFAASGPARAEDLPGLLPERTAAAPCGLITDAVAGLDAHTFAPSVLALPDDLRAVPAGEALSRLAAIAAGWYVTYGQHAPFAFIHLVTGPAALADLAHALDGTLHPETPGRLLRTAWRATVGVVAAYLPAGATPRRCDLDTDPLDVLDVVRFWPADGEEHVVKLADTVLHSRAARHLGPLAGQLVSLFSADTAP